MSDTETNTEAPVIEAPADEAPPPPEPTEPAKVDKEPDLDRAFMALNRKKEAAKRDRLALENDRKALVAEREAHAKELALLKRLRERDDGAVAEVLGEDFFDRETQRRLDPEGAAKEKALRDQLSARDQQIQELRARLDRLDQERQAVDVQRQQRNLIDKARAENYPELKILDDEEMIDLADRLATKIAAETGQDPLISDLIKAIADHVRPRYTKLRELLGAFVKVDPPKKAPPKAPTTLTAADASTPAGAGGKEPDWRQELAERLKQGLDKSA